MTVKKGSNQDRVDCKDNVKDQRSTRGYKR